MKTIQSYKAELDEAKKNMKSMKEILADADKAIAERPYNHNRVIPDYHKYCGGGATKHRVKGKVFFTYGQNND